MKQDCFVPAQIEVVDYFYPIIRFEADPAFTGWEEGESPRPEPSVEITLRKEESTENAWWVYLSLSLSWLDNAIPPYLVADLTIIGLFQFPKDVTWKEQQAQLTVSAPSILYSSARQMVKSLTGHGPYPTIQLPAISFKEGKLTRIAADKKAAAKQTSKKKVKKRTATKKTSAKKN